MNPSLTEYISRSLKTLPQLLHSLNFPFFNFTKPRHLRLLPETFANFLLTTKNSTMSVIVCVSLVEFTFYFSNFIFDYVECPCE